MENMFGRHSSQLSEDFREGLEKFLSLRKALTTDAVPQYFLNERAGRYSNAIHSKRDTLPNFMGFIDGTMIAVARPGEYKAQNMAYNCHKRKIALKYQAVTTSDVLILHAQGPLEGQRHDWTLYVQSGLQ